MNLQDVSGLTTDDPLFHYLGIADKFLEDHDWGNVARNLSVNDLTQSIWYFLGHPLKHSEVNEYHLNNFEEYLSDNKEDVLLEIVQKLRVRKQLSNVNIRLVLMFIIGNLDYFSELSIQENRLRSIDANWEPSMNECFV